MLCNWLFIRVRLNNPQAAVYFSDVSACELFLGAKRWICRQHCCLQSFFSVQIEPPPAFLYNGTSLTQSCDYEPFSRNKTIPD